ncbi:hypothetical protein PCE1_002162 [Barthelona sp. PCE]
MYSKQLKSSLSTLKVKYLFVLILLVSLVSCFQLEDSVASDFPNFYFLPGVDQGGWLHPEMFDSSRSVSEKAFCGSTSLKNYFTAPEYSVDQSMTLTEPYPGSSNDLAFPMKCTWHFNGTEIVSNSDTIVSDYPGYHCTSVPDDVRSTACSNFYGTFHVYTRYLATSNAAANFRYATMGTTSAKGNCYLVNQFSFTLPKATSKLFYAPMSTTEDEEDMAFVFGRGNTVTCQAGSSNTQDYDFPVCLCLDGYYNRYCGAQKSSLTRPLIAPSFKHEGYNATVNHFIDPVSTPEIELVVGVSVHNYIPTEAYYLFQVKMDLWNETDFIEELENSAYPGETITVDVSNLPVDQVYHVKSYFFKDNYNFETQNMNYYSFYLSSNILTLKEKKDFFMGIKPNVIPSKYYAGDYGPLSMEITDAIGISMSTEAELTIVYFPFCDFDNGVEVAPGTASVNFAEGHDTDDFFACFYRTIGGAREHRILAEVNMIYDPMFLLQKHGSYKQQYFFEDSDVFCPANTFCGALSEFFFFSSFGAGVNTRHKYINGGDTGRTVATSLDKNEPVDLISAPVIRTRVSDKSMNVHQVHIAEDVYAEGEMIAVHFIKDYSDESMFIMGGCVAYDTDRWSLAASKLPTSNLTWYDCSMSRTDSPSEDDVEGNLFFKYAGTRPGEFFFVYPFSNTKRLFKFYMMYCSDQGLIDYPLVGSKLTFVKQYKSEIAYSFKVSVPAGNAQRIVVSRDHMFDAVVGHVDASELSCQDTVKNYRFEPGVNYTVLICLYTASLDTTTAHFENYPDAISGGTEKVFGSWSLEATPELSAGMYYADVVTSNLGNVTSAHVIGALGSPDANSDPNSGLLFATRADGSTFVTLDWSKFWRTADDLSQPMTGVDGSLGINVMNNLGSPAFGQLQYTFAQFKLGSGHDEGFDLSSSNQFCRDEDDDDNTAGSTDCVCDSDHYGDHCENKIIDTESMDWNYEVSATTRYLPNVFKLSPISLSPMANVEALYGVSVPLVVRIEFPTTDVDRVNFAHVSVSKGFLPHSYYSGSFVHETFHDYIMIKNLTSAVQTIYQPVTIPFDDDVYVLIQAGVVGAKVSIGFECPANCHGIGHCNPNGTCTDCEDADRFCNQDFYPSGCPPGEYTKLDDGTCEPVCDDLPDNAECVAPGVFLCKAGYDFNANETGCIEACTLDCVSFTTCLRHNISYQECVPNEGYEWETEEKLAAEPICSSCGKNSYCVAPETCRCSKSYVYDSRSGLCVMNVDLDYDLITEPYLPTFDGHERFYIRNSLICGVVSAEFQGEYVPYYQGSILYAQLSCGSDSDVFPLGQFSKNGEHSFCFKLQSSGKCILSLIDKQSVKGESVSLYTGPSRQILANGIISFEDEIIKASGSLYDEAAEEFIAHPYDELDYIIEDMTVKYECTCITGDQNDEVTFNAITDEFTANVGDCQLCVVSLKHDSQTLFSQNFTKDPNYVFDFSDDVSLNFEHGYPRYIELSDVSESTEDVQLKVSASAPGCDVKVKIVDCDRTTKICSTPAFSNDEVEQAITTTELADNMYKVVFDFICNSFTVGSSEFADVRISTYLSSQTEAEAYNRTHMATVRFIYREVSYKSARSLYMDVGYSLYVTDIQDRVVPASIYNSSPLASGCTETKLSADPNGIIEYIEKMYSTELILELPSSVKIIDGPNSYISSVDGSATLSIPYTIQSDDYDPTIFDFKMPQLCGQILNNGSSFAQEPLVTSGFTCKAASVLVYNSDYSVGLTGSAIADIDFSTLGNDDYMLSIMFEDATGAEHNKTCPFRVRPAGFCPDVVVSAPALVTSKFEMYVEMTSSKDKFNIHNVTIDQTAGDAIDFNFKTKGFKSFSKKHVLAIGNYTLAPTIFFKHRETEELCSQDMSAFDFTVLYGDLKVSLPKMSYIYSKTSPKPFYVSPKYSDPSFSGLSHLKFAYSCVVYDSSNNVVDTELCDTVLPAMRSQTLSISNRRFKNIADNSRIVVTVTVTDDDTSRETSTDFVINVFENMEVKFDIEILNRGITDVKKIPPMSEHLFFIASPRKSESLTCNFDIISIEGAASNPDLYEGFSNGDRNVIEDYKDLTIRLDYYVKRIPPFYSLSSHAKVVFIDNNQIGFVKEGLLPCSSYKVKVTCDSAVDYIEFDTYCSTAQGHLSVVEDGSKLTIDLQPSNPELRQDAYSGLATSFTPRPNFRFTYGYVHPGLGNSITLKVMDILEPFTFNKLPFLGNVTFYVETESKEFKIKDIQRKVFDLGNSITVTPFDVSNDNEVSNAATKMKQLSSSVTGADKTALVNEMQSFAKTLQSDWSTKTMDSSFIWPNVSELDVNGVVSNSDSSSNGFLDISPEEIDSMDTEAVAVVIEFTSLAAAYEQIGVLSPTAVVSNLLALGETSTGLMDTLFSVLAEAINAESFIDSDSDADYIIAANSALILVDNAISTLVDRNQLSAEILDKAVICINAATTIIGAHSLSGSEVIFNQTQFISEVYVGTVDALVSMEIDRLSVIKSDTGSDDRAISVSLVTIPMSNTPFTAKDGFVGVTDVFTLSAEYDGSALTISETSVELLNVTLDFSGTFEKTITTSDITVMVYNNEWMSSECMVHNVVGNNEQVIVECSETGTFAAFITKSMSCGSTFFGEDCDECVRNHYGEHCEPCPLESPNGICDAGISGTGALVCVSDAYSGELCDTCNSGYYEQGSACITCPPCERGTCLDGTGNGTCQCEQYFTGTLCNMCEFGRTGTDCDECIPKYYSSECIAAGACIHGTLFDGFNGNGSCVCDEGYTGADCSETDSGYYGPNAVPCRSCENGGTCDDGTSGSGMCLCPAGYNPGTNCSTCMPGYVGASCELARDCGPGGVVFDGITGNNTCLCATGFNSSAGGVCDVCMNNRFGAACTVCPSCDNGHCSDTASGDGKCICDEYWSGALCDECIPGRRGSDCSLCVEGVIVDSNDECVLCDAGYFGAKCEKCPACVHGTCNDTITGDGMCLCEEGTTGGLCDQTLPGYRIENNTVIKTCLIDCQGNSFCNESLSDPICVCRAGWSGANCDVPVCNDCAGNCVAPDTCVCSGTFTGASCDECKNGWEGDLCDVPICSSTCVHGTCVAPERCECDADFRGVLCDEAIPKCPICPTNGFCNKNKECQCKHGWTGDECDEQVTLDESNSVFYKRINSFDSEPVLSVIIGNSTYVILDDAEIHRITNNEDEKISEALEGDVVHVFVQEEFAIYHDDVVKVFSFSAKEWEPVSAPSNGAISIAPNSIGIGVVEGILFVGSNHVFMDMPSMNLSTVNITDSPNLGPSAIFDAKSARQSNVVVHADTQLKLYGYLPNNRWVTYDPIDIECPAISVNIFDNDVIIVCPTLNATHAAIVNVSENSHTIEYIQTDTTLLSAGHLTIDDDGLTIVGQHSTTTIGTKPPVEVDPFAVEATAPQTVSGDILVSYDGDLFIVSDTMPYMKRYVEADDRWDEYTMSVTTTATDFIGNCAASRASTTGTTTRIVCVDADQKATLQVLTVDWELSTIYMDSIPIASDVAELSDASLAASETHFFIMGKTAHSSLLFKIDNVFMSTLTVSLKDTVPAAASTIVVDDDIYMFGGKPVTQVMYVVNTRSGVVTKNDVNDAHVAFAGLTGGWKFGSKLATYGTNPVTGTTVGFVIDTETLDVLRLPAELGGVSLDGKVVKSLGPRTGGSALVLLADDMAGTNPSVVEFTFYDVCGVQSSSGSVCNVETGTYVTDPEPEPEEETSYFGIVLIVIFISIFVIGAIYMNKKVEEKPEMDMFAPNFMEMEPTQSGVPFNVYQSTSL